MPLDVVYFDIPYLDNYADFTIDTKNFPDVKTFANNLHAKNQRLVVIIDAALSAEDTSSKYYTQGNKDQIFIQSNIKNSAKYGKNLVSKVWPKKAVFIDWLHDKCVDTWKMGLDDLYASLPYDGLWLDMNEATTFANGEIDGDQDVNEQEIEAQSTPKRSKLKHISIFLLYSS
jgi:alpha-glucosidase (family GH31 glycosyl hydrolase)